MPSEGSCMPAIERCARVIRTHPAVEARNHAENAVVGEMRVLGIYWNMQLSRGEGMGLAWRGVTLPQPSPLPHPPPGYQGRG
jgi:hypothetical protein